ncbi:MAG: hypothetical protein LBU65_16280, partial [Planctomycetaceae bacterium]|nr:hypothetical protein [Planctomycetaceae bacterium]
KLDDAFFRVSVVFNAREKKWHSVVDSTATNTNGADKFVRLATQERLVVTDYILSVIDNQGSSLFFADIDLSKKSWNEMTGSVEEKMIFGYLPLGLNSKVDAYIPNIMKNGTMSVIEEPIDGNDCIKLSVDSSASILFIWLDVKAKFAMRKMLASIKKPADGEPSEIQYTVDGFTESGGIKVPTGFTAKTTIPAYTLIRNNIPEGLKIEKQTKIQERIVTNIVKFITFDVNPELTVADFLPKANIPNETEVKVLETPQIKYVWLDGKIVPFTDELALARLRGHKFIPGVREPGFWFMAAGIIMIVIAIIGKIWKYINKRKSNGDT